jgi:glucose-1-phosphate thymidylyltransferase
LLLINLKKRSFADPWLFLHPHRWYRKYKCYDSSTFRNAEKESNFLKGVILAAGKGTRLYPVTYHIPKPILPLANRPTIEYAFDRLKEMGIDEICIVVGETEPQMRAALGHGDEFDVRLSYVRQEDPRGLAHAVGYARDFVGQDDFVLYLGDAMYGAGFDKYAARFKESGCANLNIVKPVPDPSRFGVANLDGERIVKLVEKPKNPESNLAMAGMYFFGPQIWHILPDLKPSARGEYEITDAIQMLIDRGETVLAGVYEAEWFDTGTLDSFLETSTFLTGGKPLVGKAQVSGHLGAGTVIGDGAQVSCSEISDSVILPGAEVSVKGAIRHAVIGGEVKSDGDVEGVILFGEP